jgi:hypothetical protein
MDLKDSPEEAAIRAEVREWLLAHAQPRVEAGVLATGSSAQAAAIADRLTEAGLASRFRRNTGDEMELP